MARNVRQMACTPEDVFRVFEDGWLFPSWVVGASRMREVAEDWPQLDSRLHHSFGVWPLLLDDTTSVTDYDPPRRIGLRARGWPMGEAQVDIEVKTRGDGCVVRIEENAVAGPGALVPRFLMDPLLMVRNAETLHRLAYLAEGMAHRPQDDTTADAEGAGEPSS